MGDIQPDVPGCRGSLLDDCIFEIEVTETLVSGHVSCAAVEVLRDGEPAGTSTIDIEFAASS